MPPSSESLLTLEEIRETWPVLSAEERAEAFELLDRDCAQQFFLTLSAKERSALIFTLPEGERKLWLRILPPDEAADIIQSSPEEMHDHLLELLDENTRKEVNALLSYKQDVAGGLMNPRFARIRPDLTVDEAIHYLRHQAREQLEGIYYVFVLDEAQRLLGVVSFHNLFKAPPGKKVREIMKTDVVTVSENEDQEVVSRLFSQYKFLALPVVDSQNRIKGIITSDDIMKVIRDEAEEDFAKMAGTQAGLLSRSVVQIARVRFPWLITTCLGYFVVGWVVKHYELTLSKVIGLASFMPLIAAMGGNVGAQTATVVVRGLATGEVKALGIVEVVMKEILVGLLLGSIYGLAVAVAAHYIYVERFGWQFSLVVGMGMFASMCSAAFMGSLEPFIFEKLKIDPATATGPLITFFADFISTSVYLTVATWLFMKF